MRNEDERRESDVRGTQGDDESGREIEEKRSEM
jgi:hypothetical protein